MAGNIIPAIATTNAVISGLIVLQALQLLRKSYDSLKNVHLQFKPSVPLSTITMCPPNPNCGICRDTYTKVLCDPSRVTLGQIVDGILGDGEGDGTGKRDVSVYENKRILSDPDWDDNNERTLESLNVSRGKFLTIVDEDGEWGTIAIGLGVLPWVIISASMFHLADVGSAVLIILSMLLHSFFPLLCHYHREKRGLRRLLPLRSNDLPQTTRFSRLDHRPSALKRMARMAPLPPTAA